ncbi:MAG: GlxA family transcriptional regulator, partial [Roseovarius sp.]|nr:GlxA family transcriptional regulator [Roseovarius sp.]
MMTSEATKIAVKAPKEPKRFVFVLLDNFTLLSFASAIECLRIANRMAEEELYSWALTGD